MERLALGPLEALEVDGTTPKGRQLLLTEVVADDRYEVDGGKEGGGHGEERSAPAEDALGLPEGGLDGVVGDASDDEDGHALFYSCFM